MKYRYRLLALLSSLSVITFLDRVCISVAGKTIQEDLGLTLQQWGWVLGAFVISYGVFEIPSGALGDRLGPRGVLTRIVVWWSAFTMLTGFCRSFVTMLIVRFLFGIGEAGAFPNSSAAIGRWFPTHERARAQSFVWMASRVGGALTPILVIPLQQAIGWRSTFLVFGLLGVGWAWGWHFWFRDDPRAKAGVTLEELAELGSSASSHSANPIEWRRLFGNANLWWIMLMYHANAWCGFFFLSWLSTFLQNGRGYTTRDLFALSWLPFVVGALANLAGGWTSDALVRRFGLKWGRRTVGVVAYVLTAVLIAAAIFTHDKVGTVILLALAYGCSDFALPVAWAVCLDVGQKNVGAVSGAMNMAGQLGSFLTTVLFGYLVTYFGSYDAPLVPIAFMSLIGAFAWLRIDPTRPVDAGRSLSEGPPAPRESAAV